MKKTTSALCAVMALAMSASTALPVAAAPMFSPQTNVQTVDGDVVQVQMRRDHRERRFERRQERREDRFERKQDRREARFERRGNRGYYNGHRGYREHRRGYREYNGFWFPPAAFIAGAIISGAINNGASGHTNRHVAWCQDRYRSYRASDNTFQPYNGPREQCYSPYS